MITSPAKQHPPTVLISDFWFLLGFLHLVVRAFFVGVQSCSLCRQPLSDFCFFFTHFHCILPSGEVVNGLCGEDLMERQTVRRPNVSFHRFHRFHSVSLQIRKRPTALEHILLSLSR